MRSDIAGAKGDPVGSPKRRTRPRDTVRSPHRPGDRLTVEIVKMALNGYGLARPGGFVVFVPRAVPGDRLEVTLTDIRRNHAFAEPLQLLQPGPDRVVPACADYGSCGGCAHLDMAYPAQLAYKKELLADVLHGLPVVIRDPVPSPQFGTRNKLLMSLEPRDGRLASGFYARDSHRLIDIGTCLQQSERTNALRRRFCDLAPSHLPDLGDVTHLLIRTVRTGQLQLCVVARKPIELAPLAAALAAEFPELASFSSFLNDSGGNVPFERKPANSYAADPLRLVAGTPYLTETVAGADFRIAPDGFFQVNAHQLEAMAGAAAEAACSGGPAAGGTLIDLYCGAGFFGLVLRDRFERVIFVDRARASIDALAERAAGDPRLVPILGDAAEAAARLHADGVRPDALIVDPPRAGIAPALADTIAALAPARVGMISCHPTTLARDIALLSARGYRPSTVAPIDNFPNTHHLECVVRLDRIDEGA